METRGQIWDLKRDIVDPVLEELSFEIEAHGVLIDNRLESNSARRIPGRGDRAWLQETFRNLLGNALNCGREGETIVFDFQRQGLGLRYRLSLFHLGKSFPMDRAGRPFCKCIRIERDGKEREEDRSSFPVWKTPSRRSSQDIGQRRTAAISLFP